MPLLCPECLGEMQLVDERSARCTVHGGVYEVLFHRLPAPPAAPAPPIAPAASTPPGTLVLEGCRRHPEVMANYTCARCGTSICATCAFPEPSGRVLCPDCAVGPGTAAGSAGAGMPPIAAISPEVAGQKCLTHPKVPAVALCQVCRAPVCATCDFLMPGNQHVCPKCVAAGPQRQLSAGRRQTLTWAYVLAVWSALGLALMFSGVFADMASNPSEVEAYGTVMSMLFFLPCLIGGGLGLGSLNKRLGNPPVVWGAAIWNGILLGIWILMIIIGSLSG